MAFSQENVSAKVAKTYTFVTEVIEISVEIASMGVEIAMSIAEVISMRASAIPTWMKRIQKTLVASDGSALVAMTAMAAGKQVFLSAITVITTVMRSMTSEDTKEQKAAVGGKKSPARAGTKEIVNRLAVSSGKSVGVALSRRRYPQQDDGLLFFDGYYQIEYNAFG